MANEQRKLLRPQRIIKALVGTTLVMPTPAPALDFSGAWSVLGNAAKSAMRFGGSRLGGLLGLLLTPMPAGRGSTISEQRGYQITGNGSTMAASGSSAGSTAGSTSSSTAGSSSGSTAGSNTNSGNNNNRNNRRRRRNNRPNLNNNRNLGNNRGNNQGNNLNNLSSNTQGNPEQPPKSGSWKKTAAIIGGTMAGMKGLDLIVDNGINIKGLKDKIREEVMEEVRKQTGYSPSTQGTQAPATAPADTSIVNDGSTNYRWSPIGTPQQ